jgi:hypothetical protein
MTDMQTKGNISFKIVGLAFLILVVFANCKTNKRGRYKPSVQSSYQDGRCYSKCLMPEKHEPDTIEYPVFIGDENEENVDIEIVQVVMRPKTQMWVKKQSDRNCLSPDPNDCATMCLMEVPEVIRDVKVLIDTTQTQNYQIQRIYVQKVIKNGGYWEWREVLCEQNITTSVIEHIQKSLIEKGYFEGKATMKFDKNTRSSIVKFQRENNLPIGNLDFETLDVLGVPIEKK